MKEWLLLHTFLYTIHHYTAYCHDYFRVSKYMNMVFSNKAPQVFNWNFSKELPRFVIFFSSKYTQYTYIAFNNLCRYLFYHKEIYKKDAKNVHFSKLISNNLWFWWYRFLLFFCFLLRFLLLDFQLRHRYGSTSIGWGLISVCRAGLCPDGGKNMYLWDIIFWCNFMKGAYTWVIVLYLPVGHHNTLLYGELGGTMLLVIPISVYPIHQTLCSDINT